MSLINQMLRDLDARRGPAGSAQVAILPGHGLVRPCQAAWQRSFSLGAWLLGGVLLVLCGFKAGHEALKHFGVAYSSPLAESGEWTRLALPEPTVRPRPKGHAAAALPEHSGVVEHAQASNNAPPTRPLSPAQAVKTDNRAAAAAVTQKQQEVERPVVASAALEPAVNQPPQPVKKRSPEQNAEHLFAHAQRALAERNWQGAEKLLYQTLEVLPRHLEARSQLVSLLLSRQADDAAEHLLVEGLASDPHAVSLAKPYAQLLAARGELTTALDVLDQLHPDAETEALSAAILQRAGRHAEAAGAYEKALLEQPEQAVWWTGLAIAREHNEEPREALQAYQRAAQLQLSEPVRQYVEQRLQALQTTQGQ